MRWQRTVVGLLGILCLFGWLGCDAFRFMGRSGSTAVPEEETWSEQAERTEDALQDQPAVRSVLTDAQ
ncbi:MAG TPA: hypothetical protein PLQ00_15760, partial [Thermoguttaceae bacterium]|nr:hypothetical protein [Thermoguttaceae bacterium]